LDPKGSIASLPVAHLIETLGSNGARVVCSFHPSSVPDAPKPSLSRGRPLLKGSKGSKGCIASVFDLWTLIGGGAAMEGDAAAAWRFSAGLKVDWYRRYVRLDLLQSEYGLSREQLVAAAKKEPGYCHIGNMFKVAAVPGSSRARTVTHFAYNPDVGCEPRAPMGATADFGPALDGQVKKRRSSGRPSVESASSLQRDASPARFSSPARDVRELEAPQSTDRGRKKRAARQPKVKHGASSGSAAAAAAANVTRNGIARTKYEALNAATKAHAREALQERFDAVGDEMQRKADETADRRVADRAAVDRRVAASKLRVAEDALADERQVNDEMKQYAWMDENVYGPVKAAEATAEVACRAAALRVDAAEADAAAWRARAAIMEGREAAAVAQCAQQVAESASALAESASLLRRSEQRALVAETQKVADLEAERDVLETGLLTAKERIIECDRAARRNALALDRESARLVARTEALDDSVLQRNRLEHEIQSHKDLAADKRQRFDRQQDELRTCTKSLKESTRCLAAARKETVQLRGGGGVDPRLVAKDEPYALAAVAVQLHRNGLGRDVDDRARAAAFRIDSVDARPQLKRHRRRLQRRGARALAPHRIRHSGRTAGPRRFRDGLVRAESGHDRCRDGEMPRLKP
jgi:hypothetical protein